MQARPDSTCLGERRRIEEMFHSSNRANQNLQLELIIGSQFIPGIAICFLSQKKNDAAVSQSRSTAVIHFSLNSYLTSVTVLPQSSCISSSVFLNPTDW